MNSTAMFTIRDVFRALANTPSEIEWITKNPIRHATFLALQEYAQNGHSLEELFHLEQNGSEEAIKIAA